MTLFSLLPADALQTRTTPDGRAITKIACDSDDESWRWRLSATAQEPLGEMGIPAQPDMQRHFVPLDATVELNYHDGRLQVAHRLEVIRLATTDLPCTCRSPEPTRTLSLEMHESIRGDLIVRPLRGTIVLLAPGGWRWFAMMLQGDAGVTSDIQRPHPLHAGDMLWINPQPGSPVHIEGEGELVLARLPVA